jgi:hypothetical protein
MIQTTSCSDENQKFLSAEEKDHLEIEDSVDLKGVAEAQRKRKGMRRSRFLFYAYIVLFHAIIIVQYLGSSKIKASHLDRPYCETP